MLSDPTGGALIGPYSSTSVTILRNDQQRPANSSGGGGGGAVGIFSLIALGLVRLRRRLWQVLGRPFGLAPRDNGGTGV